MNPLRPRQPTGEPGLGVGTHGRAAEGTVGFQVEPGVRSLFVREAGVPETLTAGIEHVHRAAPCLPLPGGQYGKGTALSRGRAGICRHDEGHAQARIATITCVTTHDPNRRGSLQSPVSTPRDL
jgi:hypothetical protein